MGPKLRHHERHPLRHKPRDERHIAREAIQLGDSSLPPRPFPVLADEKLTIRLRSRNYVASARLQACLDAALNSNSPAR